MSDRNAQYLELVSGRMLGIRAVVGRIGLRAASWPYRAAVAIRNAGYDRGWNPVVQVGVPVVSVGNLTLGGTGKTPCVEYIARLFREWDRQVAILSRGYGSDAEPNDEAMVLEENLPDVPHLQGADRSALARTAVEELESDLLILDDGFQHRRVGRDLDLVLIDATCPWGYGFLTPRGLLREPPTALRRASAAILTRCDQVGGEQLVALRTTVGRYAPNCQIIETTHRPTISVNSERAKRPLEEFRGHRAFAFCGIGNPDAFRKTLEQLGIEVAEFRAFPDHHPYNRIDVESLECWCESLPPGGVVLTTQKDLVKLRILELGQRELWAVRIGLAVTAGEDRLHELLESLIR